MLLVLFFDGFGGHLIFLDLEFGIYIRYTLFDI
jgi:hypothetical protein